MLLRTTVPAPAKACVSATATVRLRADHLVGMESTRSDACSGGRLLFWATRTRSLARRSGRSGAAAVGGVFFRASERSRTTNGESALPFGLLSAKRSECAVRPSVDAWSAAAAAPGEMSNGTRRTTAMATREVSPRRPGLITPSFFCGEDVF